MNKRDKLIIEMCAKECEKSQSSYGVVVKNIAKRIRALKDRHIANKNCPCGPVLEYKDAVTRIEVWVHKDKLN